MRPIALALLVTVALSLLAAGARADVPAPADAHPLQLSLDDTFPADVRADLQRVASDVAAAVRARIPGDLPEPRPVVCSFRFGVPQTDSTSDWSVHRVYLSATGRYWSQLTYQLSHELGHILMHSRRTNGLLESLAVALSLQTLDDMSVRWEKHPPQVLWKAYAPNFHAYAEGRRQEALAAFPRAIQDAVRDGKWTDVALYLRYRRPELDGELDDRNLQHLAAIALLSGPVDWAKLAGVGAFTDPPPTSDRLYRRDLEIDPAHLPECVERMGYGSRKEFLAVEMKDAPALPDGFLFRNGSRWVWLVEYEPAKHAEYLARAQALHSLRMRIDAAER